MSAEGAPEDPLQLVQFGSLELIARQLVEGAIMGRHRSPWKGASVEFVEHREYHPGDEIRHIDWRAFGKTGRYYVKEFEDETNLRAQLLVDASGSMAWAGRGISKFAYARMLAAGLAWLLLSQRDAVGLTLFDTVVRLSQRPTSNRDVFRQLTAALESAVPGGETSLAGVLEAVLPTLSRRSLVILISDCLDDADRLFGVLQRYRHARHELAILRVVAPEEETFPFDRPTQFRSLEQSGQRLLVDPVRLRQEYLRQYGVFSERLQQECGSLGISYRRLVTDRSLQSELGAWLASRQ